MTRCFISYSRTDKRDALLLYYALKDTPAPIAPWLDVMDVKAGSRWTTRSTPPFDDCDVLLLVLTHNAVTSEEVSREWMRALRFKRQIIPLRFSADVIPPLRLEGLQEVDFCGAIEHGIARLSDHLLFLDTRDGRVASIRQRLDVRRPIGRCPTTAGERVPSRRAATSGRSLTSCWGGRYRSNGPATPTAIRSRPRPCDRSTGLPRLPCATSRTGRTRRTGSSSSWTILRCVCSRWWAGQASARRRSCRALHGVEKGTLDLHSSFAGIVYLGAGPARDISFAGFYDAVTRLLPEGAQPVAENAWRDNPQTDVRVNIWPRCWLNEAWSSCSTTSRTCSTRQAAGSWIASSARRCASCSPRRTTESR